MADWASVLRPTPRRILEALVPSPRTLTALAKATRLTKPSLQRHLDVLVALGIVEKAQEKTPVGREVSYGLRTTTLHVETRPGAILAYASPGPVDPRFPLTGQIRDPDLRKEVSDLLAFLDERLRTSAAWPRTAVVVFGSVARNEATWKSDIDLMFITSGPEEPFSSHVRDIVADTQSERSHAVRPHFTSWATFRGGGASIHKEAAREGMIVYDPQGDPDLWATMETYRSISI